MSSSTFRVGDDAFQIRTTSDQFGEWLDSALAAYRVQPSAPVGYSIVISGGEADRVRSGKRFHILYREYQRVLRTLDITALARGLFAELESTILPDRDDAIYLRSAAVARRGRIALIPDFFRQSLERMGRRTERFDLHLPVERAVGVELETGRLVPITPRLDIPGDAVARAGEMFGVRRALQVARIEAPASVEAAFVDRGERHHMQPISRGRALFGLANAALNMDRLGGRGLECLARLVENAENYGFWAGAATPQGRSGLLSALVDIMAREAPLTA